ELGFEGTNGEHSRTTIPWGRQEEVNPQVRGAYARLARLRTSVAALTQGGHHWVLVDDDALGFVRQDGSTRVLVVLTRSGYRGHVHLPGPSPRTEQVGLFTFGQVDPLRPREAGRCPQGCPPGDSFTVDTSGPSVIITAFEG